MLDKELQTANTGSPSNYEEIQLRYMRETKGELQTADNGSTNNRDSCMSWKRKTGPEK